MTVLQVEDVKQLVFPVLLHQSDSAQIHGPLWQFRLYDNASALGGSFEEDLDGRGSSLSPPAPAIIRRDQAVH